MRGLLIKDFFCLKKQFINYMFIMIGVIAISVLFALSYRFGNIHVGFARIIESDRNKEIDILRIAKSAMLVFMLIPIACTADLLNLFTNDEKASFYKVAAAFPVSIGKRVACRFIESYLCIAVCVIVDFITIVILSSLTDIISFGSFCGVIPLLTGVIVYAAVHLGKLHDFITGVNDSALLELYDQTTEFIFHQSYILLTAAVIISAGSYFMAVYIAERKRGVA